MIWLAAAGTMTMAGQEIDHLPVDCSQASNALEINACATLDLRREQARMEVYLRQAEEPARTADEASRAHGGPSAQRGYLDASQSAWRAYAEIVCDGVHDRWKDGTIRTAMYFGCMTEMTRERTHVIWRDHLRYADSTPPALPEPLLTVSEELRSAPPPADRRSSP